MRKIRRYARQVAERFRPRTIVLFGSYAYGQPTEDSDVDLLVVMPHRGSWCDQSIRIGTEVPAAFPIDLIVRSPKVLRERMAMGDFFLREIVGKGKVLYDADHARVGRKGRRGLRRRPARVAGT